jgi:hypothetical protein
MSSLLDPLPDEGQQLVDLVAQAYAMAGRWPVWQWVAQQAFGKYGIDAETTLRNLPQWAGAVGVSSYRAVRTVPAAPGNASPDIEARAALTVYGLFHERRDEEHPLFHAFRKTVEIVAQQQDRAVLSLYKAEPIVIDGEHLAEIVSHRASIDLKPAELGLLLSGEPLTTGGGVGETDNWSWDLTRYRPFNQFVSPDARSLLVKMDDLLGAQTEQPYVPVSPDALPRALDHLNVVWKALAGHRLFYPRGLTAAASLAEPVSSGDELTARLGALADVFDLFTRTADGKASKSGALNAFQEQFAVRLAGDVPAEAKVRAAVGRLKDINEIRNGRLHTDATKWAEALRRLGVPSGELPSQQWDRIRAAAIESVYALIGLAEPLIA